MLAVRRALRACVESLQAAVTVEDLPAVEVIKLQGLFELKEMLVEVGSFQRLDDVLLTRAAMGVAVLSEDEGIPLALDDGTQNGHTGTAGDVADDIVQLDVHLVQGFLHMLDVRGTVADKHIALAGNSAEASDLFCWTEGSGEQAVAVKLLEPLAIEDVGLFAGDVFHVAGIDEADFNASMLEDIIQRYPVDAGGFHGHTGDATGQEPVGKIVKVTGESRESSDRFAVAVGWHSSIDFCGSDVDAGSVGVQGFKSLWYNLVKTFLGPASHGDLRSCCTNSMDG